jgi:hypothetical protein
MTYPAGVDERWAIALVKDEKLAEVFGPGTFRDQFRKISMKGPPGFEENESTSKAHFRGYHAAYVTKDRIGRSVDKIDHRNMKGHALAFDPGVPSHFLVWTEFRETFG